MRLTSSLLICLATFAALALATPVVFRDETRELALEKPSLGSLDAETTSGVAPPPQTSGNGVIGVVITSALLDAFKSVNSSAVKIGAILSRSRNGDEDAINSELRNIARVIQTTSNVLRAILKQQTPDVKLSAYDDHSVSQVVFQIVAKVTRTFVRVLKERGYSSIPNPVRKELGGSLGHLLTTAGSVGTDIPLRVIRAIRDNVYLQEYIKFSREGPEYRVQLVY